MLVVGLSSSSSVEMLSLQRFGQLLLQPSSGVLWPLGPGCWLAPWAIVYHRGNPSSSPAAANHRNFHKGWHLLCNAINIQVLSWNEWTVNKWRKNTQVLLRAKEHLTTAGEVTGRNIVKITSQLKTGTKVRQLASVILTSNISSQAFRRTINCSVLFLDVT